MVLYHVTKRKNLESIMKYGILPNFHKGLTCGGKKHKKVFITNDPDRIIRTQGGSGWISEDTLILEIDVLDTEIESYAYSGYADGKIRLSSFEFVIDRVDPCKIIRQYGINMKDYMDYDPMNSYEKYNIK